MRPVKLRIHNKGITYKPEKGAPRNIAYADVECVLLSEDGASLSLQVAGEVLSIAVKPGDARQQKAIEALVTGVTAASGGGQSKV